MKRLALALAATAFIGACGNPVEDAKEAVRNKAIVGEEIAFGEVHSYPGGIICGQYQTLGRWESTDFQTFIVTEAGANLVPSKLDKDIFCSADPKGAVTDSFGIEFNPSTDKVRQDLNSLTQAIERYRTLIGTFPNPESEEKLQPLVTLSLKGETLLDALPQDPWGRDYIYLRKRTLAGAPKTYQLFTLGRDGEVGGTGEDADIGIEQLKYLNHAAGL